MKASSKKEFWSNIFSLGSMDVISLILPIILMPWLTRALGIELYGQFILFITILVFGHTIIDYGVQYTGVRDASRERSSLCRLRLFYLRYQGIRFVLAIVYVVSILVLLNVGYKESHTEPFIISSVVYVMGYALNSSWFLRAKGEAKSILIASLSTKLCYAISILILVHDKSDFVLLIYLFGLSSLINGCFTFISANSKYWNGLAVFRFVHQDLKSGFPVFIGLFSPNLYNNIPLIVTGTVFPAKEFAFFAVCNRVCGIVYTLQNVLSKSLYPILVRDKYFNFKVVISFYLLITVPPFVILSFAGDTLVLFFLDIELESNFYFLLISLSVIFVSISNAVATGFLLPNGFDEEYRNTALRVSFLSMLFSIYFISYFGVAGAAISLLFARMMLMLDYCVVYRNVCKSFKL